MVKNAIDWLSRPYSKGALKGKPAAVIGTSLGQYGGVWAHEDARKALKIAGTFVIEDIKVSIPASLTWFAHTRPQNDAEVVGQLRDALSVLIEALKACAN